MQITPISPERLAGEVAELVMARPGRVRLAVDGPPAADPDTLGERVAERLRELGRATVLVRAADFLRPASVRLEFGREDPDELLDRWLDAAGLRREVLDPAAPDGSGRVLPRLWDATADRAYREPYVNLPATGVVILTGALLLGRGLPLDLTVHLHMTEAALTRHTPQPTRWTLPAYTRYEKEHTPTTAADLVILSDHPHRPALRR
ncbi:uridine kinase [Pseudonocardia sp. CNS-139]|nr:uridine kinase [Pseudonocardia sp. CNS-139]